jgi:tRNA(fMet)-specific endonuclease VapC
MSLFLLDTDTLSLVQHNNLKVLREIAAARAMGHVVGLTTITLQEQMEGWLKAIKSAKTAEKLVWASRALADAVLLWATFQLYPLSEQAWQTCEQLRKTKLNVGKNDLLIAAIALDRNAAVVTHNIRDFRRVPGLSVVDWAVDATSTT